MYLLLSKSGVAIPMVRMDRLFLRHARPVEGDLRRPTLLMDVRRLRRQGHRLTINHVWNGLVCRIGDVKFDRLRLREAA
jgi:hypothetical protein